MMPVANINISVGESIKQWFYSFKERYNLNDVIASISCCFETYPVLSFLVLAAVITYAIPIVIFLAFAITTFMLTFSGFLLIEGFGIFLLIIALCSFTVILGIFACGCCGLYFVVFQLYSLLFTSSKELPMTFHPLSNKHIHVHHHTPCHVIEE